MLERELSIGLVEDNPGDARLVQKMLRDPPVAPHRVDWLSRLDEVLDRVGREPFDVLLLDLGLPDSQGLETFDRVNRQAPMMPIIIFSGAIDEQLALEAVAHGAQDYLVKGQIDSRLLKRAIHYAIERKRVEQALLQRERALRENEDRTSFALAAAGMGVWELEFATNRLTWSDTMAPVFGLTPDHAPKTTEEFSQLIHPEDRHEVEASLRRAIAGESAYAVEFRTIWPDGSVHWVSGRAKASHGPDGTSLGLLGVDIDIGERKSLEAQLRQSQKLEAVGHLAGGVAHDFNNLLTAILGYSNFVIDTLDADDSRRSDIQEVIKAGERAARLTKQLLAFSRKQVLQPVTVDLNALVTGSRQMLGRLIGEHIDLVTVLAPELHAVRADRGQIEQIVMNLVVNARDAMPVGGRVAIETANIQLDESYAMQHQSVRPGSYVMLAVSDAGVGMNDDTKRRLFEPFFTTKEVGKGTGLGLATVYGIVKQSGGYIWVYSEPGTGTTFKIYLPDAGADRADPAVPTSAATDDVSAAGTETLLVVEDEEAVRFLTRVILEKAGYRIFDVPNPKEAQALFEENPTLFDLLVTDVIMPGSSGPKLFDRLAMLRPDLKVLYMSGYTDDAIVHHGQLDPGIELLQKPFTAGDLNRRVREVLDR
jgi:two-component system, cell cycle sensor histidine kinase and response regulator CckA